MVFDLTAAIRLNDAGFTSGARRASRNLNGIGASASSVARQLGLVVTAAAAVGLAGASVKKAMDFESQLSTIKALTGATGEEMKKMSDLALDMGSKTKYSALEAGQGIEELLKAGLTPAKVQAGGLEAALNLATAGGLDLASAAEIMSTALNAFSKDGMTAAEAANILAGTANASATDVGELKYALSMVSAVSAGVGLSFKDTNAALGVFAGKGLKGSDAGTSLKTMLLNLSPSTKKATSRFKELGLMTKDGANQFYDAEGNIKSMADISGVLQNALKDLSSEQRQSTLKTLFGTDAIRAGNILYEAGAKGINDFNKEMSKVTALQVATEKMNNASGAMEVMKGAFETFQIQVMTPLLPVIKDAALQFAGMLENLKPEQIKEWGNQIKNAGQAVLDFAMFVKDNWVPIRETIIGLTAALVAFKVGMLLAPAIQLATGALLMWRNGATLAATAQWALNVALNANPIGLVVLAIAALVGAGVVLYRNFDTVKKKTRELWDKLGAFKGVATLVLGPLGLIIRAAVTMAENWDNTKGVWENVWNGIKIAASNAVNDVIGSINKMIEKLNKIPGVNIPIIAKVDWGQALVHSASTKSKQIGGGKAMLSSYDSGLSYVPSDGPVYVHKGERILTREENKAGRSSSNSGAGVGAGVAITGNNFYIREESDINKVAESLFRKLNEASALGA